jgi:hypothetical protein
MIELRRASAKPHRRCDGSCFGSAIRAEADGLGPILPVLHDQRVVKSGLAKRAYIVVFRWTRRAAPSRPVPRTEIARDQVSRDRPGT